MVFRLNKQTRATSHWSIVFMCECAVRCCKLEILLYSDNIQQRIDHSLVRIEKNKMAKPTKYGTKTIFLPFRTWNAFQYLFARSSTLLFSSCDFRNCGFSIRLQCNAILLLFGQQFGVCFCCATYSKPNNPFYVRNRCAQLTVFLFYIHLGFQIRSEYSVVYKCVLYFSRAFSYSLPPFFLQIGQFFWVSNPFSYNICFAL